MIYTVVGSNLLAIRWVYDGYNGYYADYSSISIDSRRWVRYSYTRDLESMKDDIRIFFQIAVKGLIVMIGDSDEIINSNIRAISKNEI